MEKESDPCGLGRSHIIYKSWTPKPAAHVAWIHALYECFTREGTAGLEDFMGGAAIVTSVLDYVYL